MFVMTVILFLIPSSLLWAAWKGSVNARDRGHRSSWREWCGNAALILAVVSTFLELVFFGSWFYNGGSPHGMMPSPGIWRFVGRISFGMLVGSVAVSILGKGKWRLLIPAWAASYLFFAYLVFALERD